MNKETIIRDIQQLNKKYGQDGFKIVSLFGSYARDSYDMYSDIDLTYKIDLKGLNTIRNFIAHDYDSVDDDILEVVLRIHIPKIKKQIKMIIG